MEIHSTHKNTVYGGDIHGKFRELSFQFATRFELEDTLIILLGDNGMGFEKPRYFEDEFKRLNRKLEKGNNTLVMFRGNHDDPSWYNDKIFDRIILASDYSTIHQNGKVSLIIGGGLSVDRKMRKERKNAANLYWYDEFITFNKEALEKLEGVSIMLSHMAPLEAWPQNKDGIRIFIQNDPSLVEEDNEQRKRLSDAKKLLEKNGKNKITHWFYGHYHDDHHETIRDTKYRCIAMNKLYEEPDFVETPGF